MQLEEQENAGYGEVIIDYGLDIEYKQEGPYPSNEPVAQKGEKKESNAEYAKMEFPSQGTYKQRRTYHKILDQIKHVHAAQGLEIMVLWLQDMYLQLRFSPEAAQLLIREYTDQNVDDICNIVRKLGGKNADGMSDRGQQPSVISQENLKLAAFLFQQRLRCTFDWEVTGVQDDAVNLHADQKML